MVAYLRAFLLHGHMWTPNEKAKCNDTLRKDNAMRIRHFC